jgi:hypothetical protein
MILGDWEEKSTGCQSMWSCALPLASKQAG